MPLRCMKIFNLTDEIVIFEGDTDVLLKII